MSGMRRWKVWTYLMEDRGRPVRPSYVLCYTTYVTERGVPFDVQAVSGRKAKQIAARMRVEMEAIIDQRDEEKSDVQ